MLVFTDISKADERKSPVSNPMKMLPLARRILSRTDESFSKPPLFEMEKWRLSVGVALVLLSLLVVCIYSMWQYASIHTVTVHQLFLSFMYYYYIWVTELSIWFSKKFKKKNGIFKELNEKCYNQWYWYLIMFLSNILFIQNNIISSFLATWIRKDTCRNG